MPINVLMPALSPTMTEGALVKWHKSEGDRISAGDMIAEVETDKATVEIEAVDEGTLGKIVVPEGTKGVQVNAVIAIILEEGEDASALEAAAAAGPAPEPAALFAGSSFSQYAIRQGELGHSSGPQSSKNPRRDWMC